MLAARGLCACLSLAVYYTLECIRDISLARTDGGAGARAQSVYAQKAKPFVLGLRKKP